MLITEEVQIISGYAKGELVGALLLGEGARRTRDVFLRTHLLRHAAEEMQHAAYFADLLEASAAELLDVRDEAGEHFYARAGKPDSDVALLAMTEAFEPYVARHYQAHMMATDVPVVRSLLEKILTEEATHAWCTEWLDHVNDQAAVLAARTRYRSLMREVYDGELVRCSARGGLAEKIATSSRSLAGSKK